MRIIICGMATCIPGILFFVFNAVFSYSTLVWTKIDKARKYTIIGLSASLLYCILCFILPSVIVISSPRYGECAECDGWIPELVLGSRLSFAFNFLNYVYLRLLLQPKYFPGSYCLIYGFLEASILFIKAISGRAKLTIVIATYAFLRACTLMYDVYYTLYYLNEIWKK